MRIQRLSLSLLLCMLCGICACYRRALPPGRSRRSRCVCVYTLECTLEYEYLIYGEVDYSCVYTHSCTRYKYRNHAPPSTKFSTSLPVLKY
jgi:hypothetical protein